MANGNLGQSYLDWLAGVLQSAFRQGDILKLGDPSQSGQVKAGWFDVQPSGAYNLIQQVVNALNAGTPVSSMPWYNVPPYQGVPSFLDTIEQEQELYPGVETLPTWATEGSVVVPGKLIRMPNGSFVDYNGIPVDSNTAGMMISDWLAGLQASGQDTLTAEQQAGLDLALQQLEWEKQQYGTLSAYQAAQLGQSQQQLALQQQQYLAGLMASPADWIERWYAEHLPQGAAWTAPSTQTWGAGLGAGTQYPAYQYQPETTIPGGVGGAGVPGAVSPPITPTAAQPYGIISQGTVQNPWLTPAGVESWTGITPGTPLTQAALTGAGYGMTPYGEYTSLYPKTTKTPEEYYSSMGAYELAAIYNPAYAFGAQQAQIALQEGRISSTEYNAIKKQGYVTPEGQPIVPAKEVVTYQTPAGKITYTGGVVTDIGGVSMSQFGW